MDENLSKLLVEIHKACSAEEWSCGVELTRQHDIIQDCEGKIGFIRATVIAAKRKFNVTLFPWDCEWTCTCEQDPCQHVAALIISLTTLGKTVDADFKPKAKIKSEIEKPGPKLEPIKVKEKPDEARLTEAKPVEPELDLSTVQLPLEQPIVSPVLWQQDITAQTNVKLGYHGGIFTRSYQQARAIYDARIRNWQIQLRDNIFFVTDAQEHTESVYFDYDVKNCSCVDFVENESGTCMHIEALSLAHPPRNIVRPIIFLNNNYKVKKKGDGKNIFFTPSIKPYFLAQKQKIIIPNDVVLSDQDLAPFDSITLFEFQKESVRLMVRNKRTALVLKMGLGKTICALCCCEILGKQKIIIVSPNSLKLQWQREINRFGLGSSLVVMHGEDLAQYKDQRFLIISYEMLNRHTEILDSNFDIAIADEIQKIKNKETVSWQTLSNLKSEYLFALSGTPIQNNLSDLLSLITILNPYEIKPEWKFYEDFCSFSRAKLFGIRQGNITNLREKFAQYIINPKVDYREFKLPQVEYIKINVKLTDKQRLLHDGYMEAAAPLLAMSMTKPLTFAERARHVH